MIKTWLFALALAAAPRLHAVIVDVSIGDFLFSSSNITVQPGDTVRWTNTGATAHTVDSDSLTEAFSSGTLSPSNVYTHTYTLTGDHAYHCAFHGIMTGVVHVTAPTPTPTPTPLPCINSSDSADLFASFGSFPAQILSGEALTVVLIMNAGSGPGSYNTDALIDPQPGPGVTLQPSVTPMPVTTLAAGGTNQYTWVYSVSGAGTLSFSATGEGSDNAVCPTCVYRHSITCSGELDVITPTPSITPTPQYGQAAGSHSLMGPVPVKAGVPLCAFAKPGSGPADGTVEVFNAAGERITSARLSQGDACVQTGGWAPGIYWLQLKLNAESHWQKIAVTP